ncbi:MAG: dihydropyrimidinase, partial [Candidatus Tectomicrobia bacterium]|nr:dihydropyrimidinase [Candidatus Tectomicrobia bacterium]
MQLGNLTSTDSFETGTVAAACGGTTTVIDFTDPQPHQPLMEALRKRKSEAGGRVAIDYGLHMTIPTWHASA